jgi:hypothetical protein
VARSSGGQLARRLSVSCGTEGIGEGVADLQHVVICIKVAFSFIHCFVLAEILYYGKLVPLVFVGLLQHNR